MIHTITQLAEVIGVERGATHQDTVARISKAIYKGTDCGAWVAPVYVPDPQFPEYVEGTWGVKVGSIIEDRDGLASAETQVHTLMFPFTIEPVLGGSSIC